MLFTYYQHVPAPALGRNDEILPAFIVQSLTGGAAGFIVAAIVAAALSPSLNAMAAATVNDFYRRYYPARGRRRDADAGGAAGDDRLGAGQLAVAIGAQWMQRSVLDTGLAVLSLAAGPVLGAFLVGVLNRSVGTRAMMIGILTGIAVLFVVWWNSLVAWTWFAFMGAAVTGLTAILVSKVISDVRTLGLGIRPSRAT